MRVRRLSRPNRIEPFAARMFTGPGLLFLFAGIYLSAFLIPFPLVQWYSIAHISFASLTHYAPLAAVGLAAAGLTLVALNARMWQVARTQPGRKTRLLILGGWLAAALCALFTFPGQSTDMGDYIFRAHMLVHLHLNPLTIPPKAVIPYDAFPYLSWYSNVDTYGPLWHLIAGAVHALAGENLLFNFLAFKLVGLISIGASAWLIYSILRTVAPHYADAGLALWLWNPLVLNEGVIHGHDDFVMWAIILAGVWLLLRQRLSLGLIVLVLAGLIKASAWIVLPVAAVWLIRQRGWINALRAGIPAALIGAGVVWLAYWPLGGWVRLVEMARERSWWPTGTWTAAIFFALRDGRHVPHETVVQVVVGAATLLFLLTATLVIWKVRGLRAGLWSVMLAYLLIGAHWFQPWYVTGLVALAALIPDETIAAYMFFFTFFMLLHPLAARYYASQLTLPPGGYDARMAATTLLLPQIGAVALAAVKWRAARPYAPQPAV